MVSTDRHATEYAFRHYYATSNINRWIGEGFSFEDRLAYLSKNFVGGCFVIFYFNIQN